MSPRQDSECESTGGEQENEVKVFEDAAVGKAGNDENCRDDASDEHRRPSDVTITMDDEEKKESDSPKSDPKQFFTQLGTIVAVFSVAMDMTLQVINDIAAQNVKAVIANGLVLCLIHVPTLVALLYVLCKDKVKLIIKGFVFVSKKFFKKTKSHAQSRATTLAKKSDPRKLAVRLQMANGKGNESQGPACTEDESHKNEMKGKGKIKTYSEESQYVDEKTMSNEVGKHNELPSDNSLSISCDSLDSQYEERHVPSHPQKLQSEKEKHSGMNKKHRYGDTVSRVPGERYQNFKETPRAQLEMEQQIHDSHSRNDKIKQHNTYDFRDGGSDSSDADSDHTSFKYLNHGDTTTKMNGHQIHRGYNDYSRKDDAFNSNTNASRISQEYEKRSECFAMRHHSPSASQRNWEDTDRMRHNGDSRIDSDSFRFDSYEQGIHIHNDHDSRQRHITTGTRSEGIKHYESTENESGRKRGRSKSRETEQTMDLEFSYNIDNRNVSKPKRGNLRTMSSDRQSEKKIGRDNSAFCGDEELPKYSVSESDGWIAEGTGKKYNTTKTDDTYGYMGGKRGRDNAIDYNAHKSKKKHQIERSEIFQMSSNTRERHDNNTKNSGSERTPSLASSSQRHQNVHRRENRSTEHLYASHNGDDNYDRARSRTSRPRVKTSDKGHDHINAKTMAPPKTSPISTSNQNLLALESDEERILLMIRQIAQGKTKKELVHPKPQPSPSPIRQQNQHSANKEFRRNSEGKSPHVEGSTVVDIEDRGERRKHGRRKK